MHLRTFMQMTGWPTDLLLSIKEETWGKVSYSCISVAQLRRHVWNFKGKALRQWRHLSEKNARTYRKYLSFSEYFWQQSCSILYVFKDQTTLWPHQDQFSILTPSTSTMISVRLCSTKVLKQNPNWLRLIHRIRIMIFLQIPKWVNQHLRL